MSASPGGSRRGPPPGEEAGTEYCLELPGRSRGDRLSIRSELLTVLSLLGIDFSFLREHWLFEIGTLTSDRS